ncbi:MAG: hypothetical protein Q9191_007017 [Dirinaria sp. TL-2023a]
MDQTTASAIELNNSLSRQSQEERSSHADSQTASEFIDTQLQLEADAREALPYTFDHCTQPLGPLRQNLYACLTCQPPPGSPLDPYTPAAVCYSCSIACHGEHTLVELFNRRNFTCDCGTTRLPPDSPCTLRIDPATGLKGPVHSQPAAEGNTYNQNFRNRFCGCGEIYNAQEEKGTMFQCLGLATEADGGCGEDWWHPECVMGLGRGGTKDATSQPTSETNESHAEEEEADDRPLPPGFPDEDAFETFICYKCVDANPWIRRYAGTSGFLPPVYRKTTPKSGDKSNVQGLIDPLKHDKNEDAAGANDAGKEPLTHKKRKADDDTLEDPSEHSSNIKKSRVEVAEPSGTCSYDALPPPPQGQFSLFAREDFRDHICRCAKCYPNVSKHPQLLEEEESYEPPMSEDGGDGNHSVGTGSLLDRGEAALSNVDRVRAIEGVMVYNHLKDKVKSFLQPFAESGQAVGAEDIKAYFEKLRGDEQGMRSAQAAAGGGDGTGDGDNRREQSGQSHSI